MPKGKPGESKQKHTGDFGQFKKMAKDFEKLVEKDIQEFSTKAVRDLASRLLLKVQELFLWSAVL
ncbi:MAG: hypothetical protein FWC89_11525 [Defluviitaleaceae bacterium]|nr:hypothetical protein [Defluviitaleaceae bacterium]